MEINKEHALRYYTAHQASTMSGSLSEIELVLHNLRIALDRVEGGENALMVLEVEISKWQERQVALTEELAKLIIEAGE